ncbi:MAG: serine-type D-Ala-D-Ala carboxypeptidase D-alanyl-D-alanine carboxypeptidase [Parcubacteria group bacterium]|nr:serine-type D-Ala-D-Ala carboxypeptidase D-alanyl-D-alanine carboxypeptidase [Parcubacteria group bacterium]
MKAAEHPDLTTLIARLERRRRRRQGATTLMAAVGLIGFGVMMVPVLGNHHSFSVALSSPATSTPAAGNAYAHVALIGHAAVVYDLSTGQMLYEKNADTQLPLASLTKLLTTYAAVTNLTPDAPVVITDTAVAQEGDSGLAVGQTFALKDIARFALVASSNDAAEAIAEAAASRHAVTNQSLLASAASAAGLTQTYALNGTGLDVSAKVAGGYGSAHDIALLAGALLKQAPTIAHATIESAIAVRDYTGTVHTLPNTNQDIARVPNPLLSKTGFTDLAGGNLVVVFDAGIDHPVAVVVLGSTRDGRFTDVETLVSSTLDHFAQLAP